MFNSSHRDIGKQPWEKPNISGLLLTNVGQGSPSLSYVTLSCKVPPILIFRGEKAATQSRLCYNLSMNYE